MQFLKRTKSQKSLGWDPSTEHPLHNMDRARQLMELWDEYKHISPPKQVKYPNNTDFKTTLVLDMDETLLFVDYRNNVTVRPHLKKFLGYCASHFRVILFSFSGKDHVTKCLPYLDPSNTIFSKVLSQDAAFAPPRYPLQFKNLNDFESDLGNIMIVDDTCCNVALHYENAIIVPPFHATEPEKRDQTLLQLIDFFEFAVKFQDKREPIKIVFGGKRRKGDD